MKHYTLLFGLLNLLVGTTCSFGQEHFPVNGIKEVSSPFIAFKNATIVVGPGETIENGILIIKDGKVWDSGTIDVLPMDAIIYDLKGNYIYPSIVDLSTQYGIEKNKPKKPKTPQYESSKLGAFGWNEAIHPEVESSQLIGHNAKQAEVLRAFGVGTVLTHQRDGIARGTSSLVGLGTEIHRNMLIPRVGAHYSFSKGTSKQKTPSSLMGAIALMRQTYLDAAWYAQGNYTDRNLSLESWISTQQLPQFFECRDRFEIIRADLLGDEFGVQYCFEGNGDEYKRIEEIKQTTGSFIVPINFPLPYDVSDPFLTRMIPLRDMKDWEMAPANPAILFDEGISTAITTKDCKDAKTFLNNIHQAVYYGLHEDDALAALTTIPANMAGAGDFLGQLKPGMLANFIICSNNLFKTPVIYENWVQGERFVLESWDMSDLSGTYTLNLEKQLWELHITGKPGKHKAEVWDIQTADTLIYSVTFDQQDQLVNLNFTMTAGPFEGMVRLSGLVHAESRIWDGKGLTENGEWIEWAAVKQGWDDVQVQKYSDSIPKPPAYGKPVYPFVAYGYDSLKSPKTIWIRNAMVWTCEEEGIIEDGELLIHEGRIMAVGRSLSLADIFGKFAPDVEVIDAKGKHVTPGIIDEHSHIAISRGVNEGTQASSAEVRIGDVINPEDINIYRQLSGGVTAAQLLHGSANPIGGQSALIKLRWGESAEAMKIKDAPKFIKFALGENVKQSNWGDMEKIRFPQTRMGVEQVYYDHFYRAKTYGEAWKQYAMQTENTKKRRKKNDPIPTQPRRDLELEALYEILQQERFITCHSYQQGEINMLMHVADSMHFTLNTFTHILEGYKVADKMKAHGAGASSFADWWAYKYEVKDAIPYNGALLWEQGIITAFNSDDAEMGRRLNQEAAKAVKYGGVPEEEALKFVTLNPAKLLHLDDRMGSLKAGKDADLVIWSDHPLSVKAKCEKTFIDGVCFFDSKEDEQKRKSIHAERTRLIAAMLNAKKNGSSTQAPKGEQQKHYHCDTIDNEISN